MHVFGSLLGVMLAALPIVSGEGGVRLRNRVDNGTWSSEAFAQRDFFYAGGQYVNSTYVCTRLFLVASSEGHTN